MSIKYTVIIFLTILLVLSLSITILYLSNTQYKPRLKSEIIHRISQNLENNNNIIAEQLLNNAGLENLNVILLKVFDVNEELIYLKVLDVINRAEYIYKKNLVLLDMGKRELEITRNEVETRKRVIKRKSSKAFEKVDTVNEKYYVVNDYREEYERDMREFYSINSNFNRFISINNQIISSNQIMGQIKNIKERIKQARALFHYANRLLPEQVRQINKLRELVKERSPVYEKKLSIIYSDLSSRSQDRRIKTLNRINLSLHESMKRMDNILEKNKNVSRPLRNIQEIYPFQNLIFKVKKNINHIMKNLERIDEDLKQFYEAKLFFKARAFPVHDNVDIIRMFRKITWANNTVGYYEIGISDDAIRHKIAPILMQGIFSSTTILLFSIIAGLALAFYIVYPIHKLDKGADEILKDLKFRIKMKRTDEFGKFAHTFNHLADQLTQELSKYEKLYKEATEDQLTKLMARRYFMGTLKSELANAGKEKRSTSLLMTDIDHFKQFNDTYGHQVGDLVLARVAGVILAHIRQNRVRNDIAGRYGGEEFGILLPDTDKENALHTAERIRKEVQQMTVTTSRGKKLKVTISIGVSSSMDSSIDSKKLIERADKALYQSKEKGRNQVTYG
ncbi:MAG: diguanylate cyclase [Spirochaetes bacterium]|nr:diguanylate cyclase [Spirochaetota bacterium]